MRTPVSDRLVTAAALVVVLLVLIGMDPRVRGQISGLARGAVTPASVSAVGSQVGDTGATVIAVAADQTMAHAPLMVFVCVATLLVVFLLRT